MRFSKILIEIQSLQVNCLIQMIDTQAKKEFVSIGRFKYSD